MKVHIVTHANRARYRAALLEMHRQRYEIFVEEKGWREFEHPDRLDIDEYDDVHAVYLIAMEQGQVHGSLRLLPAWRRMMMRDHLSHFVTRGEVPAKPDVWEWTRWTPGTAKRRRNLLRTRSALLIATLEFAASRGVTAYAGVCDHHLLSQLFDMDWDAQPLGMPTPYGDGGAEGIAVTWPVKPHHLRATRALLKFEGVATLEVPPALQEGANELPLIAFEQLVELEASPQADQLAAMLGTLVGTQPDLNIIAAQGRA